MEERGGSRSRAGGRLVVVHLGCRRQQESVSDLALVLDVCGLNQRERQIAALVVRRLSASQIGREPFLSHWSVEDRLKRRITGHRKIQARRFVVIRMGGFARE